MKKRPGRKQQKPPPARRAAPAAPVFRPLHYKVVELSNVDEAALERTLNEWVPQGWSFDGLQFAMRESSKRPAMAFVFFTREGEAAPRDDRSALDRLRRLAEAPARGRGRARAEAAPVSPHERLRQLAGETDETPAPEEDADELYPLGRQP